MKKSTWAQLDAITGKLSQTSKMSCHSFSLPALDACPTGKKLSKIEGSVCNTCYACKGMYRFKNVIEPRKIRHQLILAAMADDPKQWVEAMVASIIKTKNPLFRWHDSGDIFSFEYLLLIMEVARLTPDTEHWIPTKEKTKISKLIRDGHTIPENVVFRVSDSMIGVSSKTGIDHPSVTQCGTLSKEDTKKLKNNEEISVEGFVCPAWKQGKMVKSRKTKQMEMEYGFCFDCKNCWDKKTAKVWYPIH